MPSNVRKALLVAAGAIVACIPSTAFAPSGGAEIITMPAHEKQFTSPNGMTFSVGSRDETINRIPPLNMMGTTREAFVSGTAYARLEGDAAGKLRIGYHVGCAVNIGTGTIGFQPEIVIAPQAFLNIGPVAVLDLGPGEVVEVPIREKELIPGKLVQVVMRDFHLRVNACSGPVTLRQYAYVDLETPEVDDSGAVFGDPSWL
ncbi:MspA family porin [Nocardia sp. NPDC051787]|uniref:MspA family porin n=1 Tax=Nocardia sp. NPDC051787 TaxID=3155415 RepID=UPI00341E34C5